MSREPTLASTVYVKGRRYLAGTTAEEIGPDATAIGAHAWEDGYRPESVKATEPTAGSVTGAVPVPTPSALPTPAPTDEPGDQPPADQPARRASGGARRS